MFRVERINRENKKTIALIATLIYIIILVLIMHFVTYVHNVILITEITLSVFTAFIAIRFFGWRDAGFGKLMYKQLWWFVPQVFLITCMSLIFLIDLHTNSNTLTNRDWTILAKVGLSSFLIAFMEELMFRGILLRGFFSKSSVYISMLVSTVAFSFMHSANVFGGQSVDSVGIQVVLTAVVGFSFAPLALKINNLWPLIIFHGLWDFIINTSQFIGSQAAELWKMNLPLCLIVGIALWVAMRKYNKTNVGEI